MRVVGCIAARAADPDTAAARAATSARIKHFFNSPVLLERNAVLGYHQTEEEWRKDNRGKGLHHAPWPTSADKTAKREGRIPSYDKPPFDRRGKLEKTRPEWQEIAAMMESRGSYCHATWEHANLGKVSAAITAKAGETKTYEELVRAALKRGIKILPRHLWRRWDKKSGLPFIRGVLGWSRVRRTYDDLRWNGKVSRATDITYTQAADRDTQNAACDICDGGAWEVLQPFTLRGSVKIVAACFLLGRIFRLFADRVETTGLAVITLGRGTRGTALVELNPARLCIRGRQTDLPFLLLSYDNESKSHNYISEDAEQRNDHIARQKPPKQRVEFPTPAELLDTLRRAKAGDVVAAQKIIAWHQPAVKSVAAEFGDKSLSHSQQTDQREELISAINAGVPNGDGEVSNGIFYALGKYVPDNPYEKSFGEYAKEPMKWACIKYLEQQQKNCGLSLNETIKVDDEDDASDGPTTWQDLAVDDSSYNEDAIVDVDGLAESERTRKARSGALGEALDLLDERSRLILEARKGLNGSAKAVTLAKLATEWGISEARIYQIETEAFAAVRQHCLKKVTERP